MINIAYAAAQKAEETGTLSEFFSGFFSSATLWIIAGVVFIVSFWVALFVKKIVVMRLSRKRSDLPQEVLILAERVVYFVIVLLGVTIAFNLVGINFASLLGFLGLGIGFAFKDLLANFIAGVVILTQKKFKIGDLIKINDDMGHITEIDTRTTQIRSLDGTLMIIPNSDMLTSVVQNYTANSFRRISFQVGVHYDTPLKDAVELTRRSVTAHKEVVPKPEAQVLAMEFGESSITLEIRFWIESTKMWPMIRSEIIQQLKRDFDAAGITIPFPIRTIALDDYDKNLKKALHLPGQHDFDWQKTASVPNNVPEVQLKTYMPQQAVPAPQNTPTQQK